MDHSPVTALSDVSFSVKSTCSSVTSFDDVESTPDDLGVEDEGNLLTFISKLQQGITKFLDAAETSIRPMQYNKMGNPAPWTKRYADISSFFQKWLRECATDSGIQPAICGKPKEQIEKRQEEEEEVDERDVVPIIPMTGANLRQEEESEEEGASNNKGLSTATDPQSIAGSSASGSEKNERHGQHVPRVTIEEIEDEDCETTEHGVREEHEDEDESSGKATIAHIAGPQRSCHHSYQMIKGNNTKCGFSGSSQWDAGFLAVLHVRPGSMSFPLSASVGVGILEDNEQLPESLYGQHRKSRIEEEEDLAQEIHLHLQSLNKKYLKAVDIVRYLAKPEVKEPIVNGCMR
ncbi:hypothetical protein JB92DRAFT_3117878 [Gautieria morchelliformis]|nr:hypothetical protein JB92DRAFT_3117878 [Gautieria morchelliformis]